MEMLVFHHFVVKSEFAANLRAHGILSGVFLIEKKCYANLPGMIQASDLE
jgi:hypothetical protein